MPRRIVVVGGDAAGMSAASTVKRALGDSADVLVLERQPWTSYSACGIPYWIAGDVPTLDDLIARTPDEHRANGIDVRTETVVTGLDLDSGKVTARDADGERSYGYDELVIATGAEPQVPEVPGADAEGIYGVQTLDQGAAVLDALEHDPKHVVVVGSGYIGLEMAEACVRRGLETVVVGRSPQPMTGLDPELGTVVADEMRRDGITVRSSETVTAFETDAHGRLRAAVTDQGTIETDLVILGTGVKARTELAAAAGLSLGVKDALPVDGRGRVDADRHVWAAGDCVESFHRVSRRPTYVPLGTHANKQGVVVGKNLAGHPLAFPGVVGTAMTKVVTLEIALTGLGETDAAEAGFEPVPVTVEATTFAGYMPGVRDMTIRVVADRPSRRLLGAQIVGREGSALRIDSFALALWNEMTVDDLMMTDLGYAPPYSSVWDPVQQAARRAASVL
ncbi:NADPH-dependent 2,4-dienoyl-CoA reductase/sulfur reductase-like enzyme [Mumia flava]|uniref:NADPH-dependent 2,4-dienoyl-CoA reductase/sulfur reductase-like enzyme n=1 Tax=Mumia flava TaxID=1348852 RepID=A0A0B2BNW9_9ACTN|nr:FAD-dependent oxidoreductase [Mumia flava]PJJ57293.1 NADPH-dependent 2,4-dienoyl-CoA reductase/sulfur reductase-like enzyme [Mumia flava]